MLIANYTRRTAAHPSIFPFRVTGDLHIFDCMSLKFALQHPRPSGMKLVNICHLTKLCVVERRGRIG